MFILFARPINMKQINENEFEWDMSDKTPKTSKLKDYLKNKYIAWSLVLALLTWGWYITKQITNDKISENKENVVEDNYPFKKENLPYRDNFTFKPWIIDENPAKWVYLKHDAWLTFYIVQPEDIKQDMLDLEWIRKKLAKIPQFKYLERDEYERKSWLRKTKSFNVPKWIIDKSKITHIKKWKFLIPIPIDSDFRKLSAENFANYCHEAIQEIETNHKYWKHIQELLIKVPEKELIAKMLAFARSETTEEYTSFTQSIWSTELHRREESVLAFSFTYFHILMEKNADWKTSWPWLRARLNLWLTEWETYHPKNAAKLFLWYRIEKTNWNLNSYFPIREENITHVAKTYNWSISYTPKFKANYQFSQKLLNWWTSKYDNINLEKSWIEYIWLNSKSKKTYKYTVQQKTTVKSIKKEIVKIFNENKNYPKIKEANIVRKDWTAISDKIILNEWASLYILTD